MNYFSFYLSFFFLFASYLSCFLLSGFLFVKSTVGLRNSFIMVVEIQQRLWMIARICYGISVYTVSGGNTTELQHRVEGRTAALYLLMFILGESRIYSWFLMLITP